MLKVKGFASIRSICRRSIALSKYLTTSARINAAAHLPPRPVVKEEDLDEAFLKGSGPGGQKIVCDSFSDFD